MMMSVTRARLATDFCRLAPSSTNDTAFVSVRVNTWTVYPACCKFFTILFPITPVPIKPIDLFCVCKIPLLNCNNGRKSLILFSIDSIHYIRHISQNSSNQQYSKINLRRHSDLAKCRFPYVGRNKQQTSPHSYT